VRGRRPLIYDHSGAGEAGGEGKATAVDKAVVLLRMYTVLSTIVVSKLLSMCHMSTKFSMYVYSILALYLLVYRVVSVLLSL
jgi:hypothetical protein